MTTLLVEMRFVSFVSCSRNDRFCGRQDCGLAHRPGRTFAGFFPAMLRQTANEVAAARVRYRPLNKTLTYYRHSLKEAT